MDKRRKSLRTLELALLGIAIVLLGVYGVARLHRMSGRNDVRDFERARAEAHAPSIPAPAPTLTPPAWPSQKVDVALWSPKRVREYHESLTHQFTGPLAVLTVPKLKIQVAVLEGTDELALNRGVGWIAGTPKPGESGNTGIAGHRDGFFRGLKDIKVGDEIDLETMSDTIRYKVDQLELVTPDNVTVLAKRPTDSLTLVTCYPFYFVGDAPQRFIVHAAREQGPGTEARR
jgi:sortase A